MNFAQNTRELEVAYPLLHKKLIVYFTGKMISPAEDYADEVIERVLKKISEGEKIENINAFAFGVAKFVFLEYCRRPKTVAINSAGAIETEDGEDSAASFVPRQLIAYPETDVDESIREQCLRKSLDELPAEKKELLLAYYSISENSSNYIEQRKRLAARYGLRLETLYTTVCRLRKKTADSLNKYLAEENRR